MAYGPSQRRKLSDKEVREVNLIPIMNLFIVIIPMLMTIMVSAHLAMNEITLPTGGGAGGGEEAEEQVEETPKKITLGLYVDRFELLVEGESDARKIPLQEDGSYNYPALDKQLNALKGEHENQNTVEILPDGQVLFDVLLRSIDICKMNEFPNIKYMTAQKKLYRAAS